MSKPNSLYSSTKSVSHSTFSFHDAAAAAIVWADLRGYDLQACAQLAQLAGSITCRSTYANNPDLAALPQLV